MSAAAPGDAARIYVAGHRGMVGAALLRALSDAGYRDVLTRTSVELDLREQQATRDFFARHRPTHVYMAAARVGGIDANRSLPAQFIYDNLQIASNVIHAAHEHDVHKLLFLGSTCIYPRLAPQPLEESSLLTGPLEPTNEWYAVAKIAGIKLCQAYRAQYGSRFISVMPTNLFGPGDNFDPASSHVMAALLRRFHEAVLQGAPSVEVWGTGTPRREFLHVDDLAEACLFLMQHYDDGEIVNVGVGRDLSILELAHLIADITGFGGTIRLDPGKPDGTPRKLVDCRRIHALGWRARIPLERGLRETYEWFRVEYDAGRIAGAAA
jgi:GDP-L-fucose synthase